jgi:hypothetical protein
MTFSRNLSDLANNVNVNGTLEIAGGGTGATTAANALTALGAYPATNPNGYNTGTVTSVSGTGTVNGLTLTGTVTTSGSLTLGGTLSLVSPPAIGSTTANTGKFTTLEATGVTTVQAGTVSAPAITTTGDTNTGIFFPAANTTAVTTNGTERIRVTSNGVLIGTTTASTDPAGLNVAGPINGGYEVLANNTTAMRFAEHNAVRTTVTASQTFTTTVPRAGAICVLTVLTSGITSYAISFGTGFKTYQSLTTGTASNRLWSIVWVSDGTNLIDIGRSSSIPA